MPLILIALSAAFATIPMFTFLAVVWWMDRYEREPVWLLLLTFAWGALGAIATALDGSATMMDSVGVLSPPLWMADAIGAVFIAPLVEEPAKAVVLLIVALTPHFDNATDGFVYGAAAGLGFGMTENFMYFSSVAAEGHVGMWAGTVVVRTLYSAVMHATASSVVGACIGAVKFRGVAWVALATTIGLAIAMAIHMAWNGLLTLEGIANAGGLLALSNFFLFPLEFLVIFSVFQGCLWLESRMIRRELAEEVASGLLPDGHAKVLSSYWRRIARWWTEGEVFTSAYIHATTTLALRKSQHRQLNARGSRLAPGYQRQVDALREEVAGYLRS
ncbi:MAG: PrsW family intramembrane metalloprotease [Proteobacteria bacterium]|nr:PrsW family intramembrane metalloprotease [Pseudomonadota bacterium]